MSTNAKFLNVHHGLFECHDVLNEIQINNCMKFVQKNAVWITTDDTIDQHPFYAHLSPKLGNMLDSVAQLSNLRKFFGGFHSHRAMVLKYDAENADLGRSYMSLHRDTPIENESIVFTVVLTIRTTFSSGGNLIISNRDDGKVSHSKDKTLYETKHNSMYALFGSHATHAAQPMVAGSRYSFALFYSSNASYSLVVVNWLSKPTPFVCFHCRKCYVSKLSLHRHRKKYHPN